MGGVCASCMAPPELETNPDGTKKDMQTKAQVAQDGPELRRAARICDLEQMLIFLGRMPLCQINSGTGKTESTSDELGMTALHYSAAANHLRGCKQLLLFGANVNSHDALGRSPLHVVLENGNRKVASFLLDQGANRNKQDKHGYCPLMSVLLSGNKGTVIWFLDKTRDTTPRLNLTLTDKEGNTCILVAAMYGWWDVVDKLLTLMLALPSTLEGSDTWDFKYKAAKALSTRNKQGETLLGWVLKFALSGGFALEHAVPLVKHLISAGTNAATPCFKENCTPLNLSAAIGNRELFNVILEASGPTSLLASDGLKRSALHFAAAKGHLELVGFLIGKGLRVDKMDANKDTPLHLAAMRGHEEVCQELLAAAAALKKEDPESQMEPIETVLLQPNSSGLAVIHMALKAGPMPEAQATALNCLGHLKPEQVQIAYLHARKKVAGVSIVDKEAVAETPLLLAVSSHAHAVVKKLLEEPFSVPVNEHNAKGETAMLRCLSKVTRQTAALDATILKLLIDAGAKASAGSGKSPHPLLAVCQNDCNAFTALALQTLTDHCQGGVLDWSVKDNGTGRMPIHEASLYNNVHIVRKVLESTGKEHLESVCKKGITPLAYAAWGCSVNCMKVLLNHGADMTAQDRSGVGVLEYCMRLDKPESLECAALLLRAGALPIDTVDVAGEGLLHRAVRYGASDFIRLWYCHGGNMGIKCSTKDVHGACDVPTILSLDPALDCLGTVAQHEQPTAGGADLIDREVEVFEADMDDEGEDTEDEELEAPNIGLAPLKSGQSQSSENHISFSAGSSARSPASAFASVHVGAAQAASSSCAQPTSPALLSAKHFLHMSTPEEEGEVSINDVAPVMCDPKPSGSLAGKEDKNGAGQVVKNRPGPQDRAGREAARVQERKDLQAKKEKMERELKRLEELDQQLGRRSNSFISSSTSTGLAASQTCNIELPSPPLTVFQGFKADPPLRLQESSRDPGPVGEACEQEHLIDWWPEEESIEGTGFVRAPSFYEGPCIQQLRKWTAQGTHWWDEWFTIDNVFWDNDWNDDDKQNEEEEDLELEMKDGYLTLDDLLFEVIKRQERGDYNGPGAICEGLLEAVSLHSPASEGDSVMKSLKEQRDKERQASSAGGLKLSKLTSNSGGGPSASESLYGSKEASPSLKDKMADLKGKTPSAGKVFKSFKRGGADVGKKLIIPSYDRDPKLEALDNYNQEKSQKLVSELFARMYAKDKMESDDPFYDASLPYHGTPSCMKADVSEMIEGRIQELVDSMQKRIETHMQKLQDETPLQGPELRERNISCWINSLSPDEYPLKLGGWKQLPKLQRRAIASARARGTAAHNKPKTGLWTAKLNSKRLLGLPTRPKHELNTALIYAVRLSRPSCVRAILDGSQGLNADLLDSEDLFGHTALEYAFYQLSKDRLNTQLQAITDMLLIQRPQVKEANFAGHNPMQPLILAVIAYDLPRIAWLVRKCAAPVQASWMYGPDIPTYFGSQWEKHLGPLNGAFGPIHIAILHKRLDVCKLLLELGASPNEHAWGLPSKISPHALRSNFIKSLRKGRKEGKSDEDAILLRKEAALKVQAKALEFVQERKHAWQQQIKLQQEIGRHYAAAKEEGGIIGEALKLVAGAGTAMLGLANKLRLMVAKMMHGPDVWISPLHLAARLGSDDVCLLLLDRGAAVNGGKAACLARKTPTEEALTFAKANFRYDNRSALNHNWEAIRLRAEAKIPAMNIVAKTKQVGSTISMIAEAASGDAIKPIILAARVVIAMIMNSLKRQVAHYDPALRAAHVLMWHAAPLRLDDGVTHGTVKDMMNNGTWGWLGKHAADVNDATWLHAIDNKLDNIANRAGLPAAAYLTDPKDYRKCVTLYMTQVEVRFFEQGAKDYFNVLQRETRDQVMQLSSKYDALAKRAYAVYSTARKESELFRLAQSIQGMEYQLCLLDEMHAQQKRGAQDKFLELPMEDEDAVTLAGFDPGNPAEFLGGAWGHLMSGGDSPGKMELSASLKNTHMFNRRSTVANTINFEVPKTIDDLQQRQNPLGSGGVEAARMALPETPTILRNLQQLGPPEELMSILKSKLQALREKHQQIASRAMEASPLAIALHDDKGHTCPADDLLRMTIQANQEAVKAMEDEVALDSLARVSAGAEFKLFVKTLIWVTTMVAPALSEICDGV